MVRDVNYSFYVQLCYSMFDDIWKTNTVDAHNKFMKKEEEHNTISPYKKDDSTPL